MHVLQGGGHTVDEDGEALGIGGGGVHGEGAAHGLVEDVALRIGGRGDEPSTIDEAHGVGVEGAVAIVSLLDHFDVDIL